MDELTRRITRLMYDTRDAERTAIATNRRDKDEILQQLVIVKAHLETIWEQLRRDTSPLRAWMEEKAKEGGREDGKN